MGLPRSAKQEKALAYGRVLWQLSGAAKRLRLLHDEHPELGMTLLHAIDYIEEVEARARLAYAREREAELQTAP